MERHQSQPADNPVGRHQASPTPDYQAASAAEPKKIGRFEILELLGQGAFGKVYKARDPRLDRAVAIKVPIRAALGQPDDVDRFLREARTVAALHHPNLCAVHEVGKSGETLFIVMAYVQGKSLADHLSERKQPVDAKQAALIVRKLALGLAAAHAKGIVHRDLKPANVMIDRDRKDVVIMDFGLAHYHKQGEAQRTWEGVIMGTPAYMSPEQARGDVKAVGPASDTYSLGAILYEMLAGRPPFTGSLTEIIGKVLLVEPEPPSRVRPGADARLEAICLKALAKNPAERYASMREPAEVLEGFLKGVQPEEPKQGTLASGGRGQGEGEDAEPLSRVMRALASEYRQEARAAVEEAVRRARIPLWKLLASAGVLVALLVAGLIVFGPARAVTSKTVLLKIDVNLKDPTLVFVLDGREIPGQALQAPLELALGEHELVVLRDSQPVRILRFEVGRDTETEIALKEGEPPPGEDEADFPPGLDADAVPSAALPPPSLARQEARRKGEWVQLFNGKDLSGWRTRQGGPGNWRVTNGILTCDGGPGHLLTEENDWSDMQVLIEAKFSNLITPSRLFLRAPFARSQDRSYHVDIGGTMKRPTGSITVGGRAPGQAWPKTQLVPPDTWFRMEVMIRGHHIVTKINDQIVADFLDEKKTHWKGHFALAHYYRQGKGAIHFRRIEARDLAPERLVARPAAAGKFTVHTIPLPDAVSARPATPHLMIGSAPGGGFKLGWNDGTGRGHITTLGPDLKPVGGDIVLPNLDLRGLAVNDDGSMVALVFELPCQMHALGLDSGGRELFKTTLTGAKGDGPGTRFANAWFRSGKVVSSGHDFAVHFGHFVHTNDGERHQGGYYAQLDRQGNKLLERPWTVSHSIDQALLHHSGDWLTVSVGDAFPRGLPFFNRTQKARRLIYPPAAQAVNYQPETTHLGNMVAVGDDVGLAFVTRVDETSQFLYVLMDKAGEVESLVKLHEGRPVQGAAVNLAPFGPHLLFIWTETETRTGVVPIDSTGRFLSEPTFVDEPFGGGNDLAIFPNGDVGWLTASRGTAEVKLVRLSR